MSLSLDEDLRMARLQSRLCRLSPLATILLSDIVKREAAGETLDEIRGTVAAYRIALWDLAIAQLRREGLVQG